MPEPIGSIVAYAGGCSPAQKAALLAQGWALCDGSELPRGAFAALFTALGSGAVYGPGNGNTTFNVPDCRGYFLRGVDDPDGTGSVPAANRDPNRTDRRLARDLTIVVGDVVGSVQLGATAVPVAPFGTVGGGHEHRIGSHFEAGALASGGVWGHCAPPSRYHDYSEDTRGGGGHGHGIVGGDMETRPRNVSVNWLIRAA